MVPLQRDGQQAQLIERPIPRAISDNRLARMLDTVRENLADPHTLDSLAAKARMSRRSFTRHFRALTGTTVKDWLMTERLALAQRLLESSGNSVEAIARVAGFRSTTALRDSFRAAFGVSPTAWRKHFKTPSV